MEESLSERQEFEVEALKAIYDNDFEVWIVNKQTNKCQN